MIGSLPPGSVLLAGALAIPLLPKRLKQTWLLALPLASLAHLLLLGEGHLQQLSFLDYTLTLARVDKLSLVFGYVFHLAAFVGVIFALRVKDDLQHVAAMVYGGAAISAAFAGDLVTLFVHWELTAISSVFLIWASRSERAYGAGMRYLVIQVGSGVLLLSGTLLHYRDTGSLEFSQLGLVSPGTALIFLAFGIKCAFPLLHNWLPDAYPESTVTGTVFLSAFTTKLAVYALARGFAGTEMLIWIGAIMTVFPILYAVIEDDLRRVLAYSLNNQLGFMVVGVGIGSEMALNGAVSHAFAHILYKALLFMSIGAVLHRAGTVRGSELGGLYKSMPWTTAFCCVGAASISALPLFGGFATKSLVLTAAAEEHHVWVSMVLLFASACVFHYCGIRIPFLAFFARDSGIRCKEAPLNMLVAMGITAALCVLIGCIPGPLYAILPFPVDYAPYTPTHVLTQLQLLLFSALAFWLLRSRGLYPAELRSVNLDSDWVYRRLLPAGYDGFVNGLAIARARLIDRTLANLQRFLEGVYRHHGPQGVFARSWPTGSTVLWVALFLGAFLILYYF